MILIGHTVGLIGQYPYGDDLKSWQYDSSSGPKMFPNEILSSQSESTIKWTNQNLPKHFLQLLESLALVLPYKYIAVDLK